MKNARVNLSGESRFFLWRNGLRTTRNRGIRQGSDPELISHNPSCSQWGVYAHSDEGNSKRTAGADCHSSGVGAALVATSEPEPSKKKTSRWSRSVMTLPLATVTGLLLVSI